MTHHRRPSEIRADLGPSIRRQRGDVVVTDAPDPDSPNRTIRRGMAEPHYARLWRAGAITDDERNACDRYCYTSEAESGAMWRSGEHVGGVAPPWRRGHPTMTQVQASAALRHAHAAVGPDGTALLRLYVRDGLPLSEIGRRRGEREEVAKGRVLSAIRRLGEHWGADT